MIDTAAALAAWFGASLVVLSDGRRGQALGLGLIALAGAVLSFDAVGLVPAAALGAGGALAAARRYVTGPEGWGIMPPGSTPRLVLCLAAAIAVFWFASGVATGPGGPLRFATVITAALAAARVLESAEEPVVLTAIAALALAVGVGACLDPQAGPWAFIAAGVVAAAAGWLPLGARRAA